MVMVRPHSDSIDGCNIKSTRHFLHLIDHMAVRYGGLPTTESELGTVRQEPFMSISSGISGPNQRFHTLRTAHTTHRWIYTRAKRLLEVSPDYASLVLDSRYLVYPSDWHPDIRAAFGLEDPPTPTEVFSLFHTMYVPYHTSMKRYLSMHELCLLDYYCVGAQLPALAACYQVTVERIIWLLAQTIRRLMTHLFFSLWATGSDLTCMMMNKATRLYLTDIMGQGVPRRQNPYLDGTAARPIILASLRAIREKDPYYNLIVNEGLRLNPIPRAFTATRWAWPSTEAKNVVMSSHWYIMFSLQEKARNHWMRQKLFGEPGLSLTTKIVYLTHTLTDKDLSFKPHWIKTDPEYKELAELYGKGTIDETDVARLRAKWSDSFYARKGRYPGSNAHRRLAGLPTNGPTNG